VSPEAAGTTPAIDPARLVIAYGYLAEVTGGCTCGGTDVGIGFEHEQGCGLELVMPLTDLVELIQQGAPALPEPDRWIPDSDGHQIPQWDTPYDIFTAWTGGVEVFGGYREDLNDVERTALAVLSAVRYARRYTAELEDGAQ